MRRVVAVGLSALASCAWAQVASVCPTTNVCFKLNIPQNTASSGNGDIFFQLSAPSTYEWVALGQGSSMSGSNIFVAYVDSSGSNVTLSPRLGTGHQQPNFNSAAQVTLLEGSGVSNGMMTANVKCSNCNSWSGGTADFTSSNGNWIYAAKSSGGPKKSDDQSASINQHSTENAFQWSYASAKGGDSVNPLVSSSSASGTASGGSAGSGGSGTSSCVPRPSSGASGASAGSGSGGTATSAAPASQTSDDSDDDGRPSWAPSSWTARPTARPTSFPPSKRDNINYCDSSDPSSNNGNGFTPLDRGAGGDRTKMLIAHGTLAALAFVVFFPAGAIAIRLASFPGVIWLHAAFQVFAYLVYTIAFGLGVYIANDYDLLDKYHPIIGIVVFVVLFFQPLSGFLHHALFKKYVSRTFWSYLHLWLGRSAITLGIINGGLGFKLAKTMNLSSKSGEIAYSVVAVIVWLTWVAASIYGERKRKRTGAAADRPPKYTESPPVETEQHDASHGHRDIPTPPPINGHYGPR